MSPRQARRERREVERKARKAELKRAKAAAADLGFVSQVADLHTPPTQSPERSNGLRLDEAALLSEPKTPKHGFVSQNTPRIHVPLSRVEINRKNAEYSTGPRSANGKLASSRNSLKHGLAGSTLIIPGEDAAAFEALRDTLLEEHQPATQTEELLIQEMAQSWWLTQRAIRLQNECFTFEGVDQKQLSLLLRYQTTHDRAFYKALNTLVRLKKERLQTPSRFVSQTVHSSTSPTQSPEQSDGLRLDEAAVLSEPKTPANGFVSQNAPEFGSRVSSICLDAHTFMTGRLIAGG